MKKLALTLLILAVSSMAVMAQGNTDLLAGLTFESHQKYIRPNKQWVPLRTKPNAKSAKVTDGTGDWKHDVGLDVSCMRPVLAEQNGWYKVSEEASGKTGWINKKDAKVCVNKPITPDMMNTNQAGYGGYDDGTTWRVYGPIGKHELAVCFEFGNIRLGKIIDNVFVFKYCISSATFIDEENPAAFDVHWELYDGTLVVQMKIGTNFCTKLKPGWKNEETGEWVQDWVFDLSKLNDKVLLYLFKDVIEQNKVQYHYINSEMLTGDFANYSI